MKFYRFLRKPLLFGALLAICLPLWGISFLSAGQAQAAQLTPEQQFLTQANLSVQDGAVVLTRTVPAENRLFRREPLLPQSAMAMELVTIIPNEGTSAKQLAKELKAVRRKIGSGDQSASDCLDETGAVELHTTVYYSEFQQGDRQFIQVTQAEGGYTILNGQASILAQQVNIGCLGLGGMNQQLTQHPDPAQHSWRYEIQGWDEMDIGEFFSLGGISYRVTIGQNGRQWEHSIQVRAF